MTAAISKTTLFSNAWSSIYSIVNSRSNIRDPSDSNGTRKFVYARIPNIKGNNIDFPFIVLNQPKIISQSKPSLNMKRKMITYACEIEIYTCDSLSGSASLGIPNGKAQQWLNQISDDVYKTFNDLTVRKTLQDARIENVNLTTNDMSIDTDMKDNIVFIGNFTLSFYNRKDVY